MARKTKTVGVTKTEVHIRKPSGLSDLVFDYRSIIKTTLTIKVFLNIKPNY